MKKLYPLLWLIGTVSFAQVPPTLTKNSGIPSTKSSPGTFDVKLRSVNGQKQGFTNNIPAVVMKSFLDEFVNATDISWVVDEESLTASFTCNDEFVIARYQKDGYLLGIRRTYEGRYLPRAARTLLSADTRKGYSINAVTEVQRGEATWYEVVLQDETHWLVVILEDDGYGKLETGSRKRFKKG